MISMAGENHKIVEIEGRTFQIGKFSAVTGLIVAKMFVAKIIPVFQSFMPIISAAIKGEENAKEDIISELDKYLDFEGIAKALDMVSPEDLTYIMQKSMMCCAEVLPAGLAPWMNPNGTYGVPNVEFDVLLSLRLVCEAVILGCGGFFDGDRLASIMSPLSSLLQLNQ